MQGKFCLSTAARPATVQPRDEELCTQGAMVRLGVLVLYFSALPQHTCLHLVLMYALQHCSLWTKSGRHREQQYEQGLSLLLC